jgi:hypothetical protein
LTDSLNLDGLNKILVGKKDYPLIENSSFVSNKELSGMLDYKVPDVIRYEAIYRKETNTESWKLNTIEDSKALEQIGDSKNKYKHLIVLLESPHKDEFNYKDEAGNEVTLNKRDSEDNYELAKKIIKIEPKMPAQGKTRELMDKRLLNILSNIAIGTSTSYKIFIVNPIQVQTSLIVLHGQALKGNYKKLRDYVWIELWKREEYKKDFSNRLFSYTPQVIINCCTKNLQPYIDTFIMDKYNGASIKYYRSSHPMNWNYSNGRILEQLL